MQTSSSQRKQLCVAKSSSLSVPLKLNPFVKSMPSGNVSSAISAPVLNIFCPVHAERNATTAHGDAKAQGPPTGVDVLA